MLTCRKIMQRITVVHATTCKIIWTYRWREMTLILSCKEMSIFLQFALLIIKRQNSKDIVYNDNCHKEKINQFAFVCLSKNVFSIIISSTKHYSVIQYYDRYLLIIISSIDLSPVLLYCTKMNKIKMCMCWLTVAQFNEKSADVL